LTLVDSVVHDNGHVDGDGQGGGIFNRGTVSLQHSSVIGNSGGYGGGIFNFHGTLTVFDSTIAENTSVYGGGIASSGPVEIVNSAILENSSSQYGGGILNQDSLTVIDSVIAGNQGGGVYNQEDIFTLTRSTISDNSGAGIRNLGRGTVVATNSTISNNSWVRTGGIYNFRGAVALTHCTIVGNESTLGLGPGGIENNSGVLTLADTILANNVSTDGPDCSGSITSLGYNLVGSDLNCDFSPSVGDVLNVDPILGLLADNGGLTETHALLPGSPAIDAVPVANCTDADGNPLTTDQRGVARPRGDACDIGAYESEPPSNSPPQADAGNDSEMECSSPDGAQVLLDGSGSTDPDSLSGTNYDIVLFEWFQNFGTPSETLLGEGEIINVTLPLGEHLITLKVTDSYVETDTDDVVKIVVDTTPPELSANLDPEVLWPPNHHMVDVESSVIANDICGAPTIVLASLTSNEADDAVGNGDGSTSGDIQPGTDDFHFSLRAERAGTGNGRIYTAVYSATDESGNAASEAGFVVVPHDRKGVIDPVEIAAERSAGGTVIFWPAVSGAESYDVIRGDLNNIVETGAVINLGTVLCIEANSTNGNTLGWEDSELPNPGQAFFYLVEYYDGISSTYGTESADKPRAPGAGDCQ
jgi:hypothetical protein